MYNKIDNLEEKLANCTKDSSSNNNCEDTQLIINNVQKMDHPDKNYILDSNSNNNCVDTKLIKW